ncbi:hypothetical protein [Limnohabitans sp. WS1]|uniref:hypothetical protein n=1 Tax=Limnohabitans sp. WS1 TaxID=1100726 RepID=UPI0011B1FFC9|nr:hypothetical protein [Limnohabitans sp. WS1]
MKAITASTIAACVFTLTACGSPRVLHDDAAKLVMIESGMTITQITQIMGMPVASETRPDGFKCLEYTLLKKSVNFTSAMPQPHYVMMYQGKAIASGQNGCNVEMMSANFHTATFGKYARFVGQ